LFTSGTAQVALFFSADLQKLALTFFSKVSLGDTFDLYPCHTTAKGGADMQSALERRQAILELLSDRRQETVTKLMSEFDVSRSTILRDIEILSYSAPIYAVQGNGGGVRVADGYFYGRRYLCTEQEALLLSLMDGLQPKDQKTIRSILARFGMPKITA
jgi:hypothetical protein